MDGTASTARSKAAGNDRANPSDYITIVVLVTGVIGGLVLVISVILFCKYCLKSKKVLKRQPALLSRYGAERGSYTQYSQYDSYDSTSYVPTETSHSYDTSSHQRSALLHPHPEDKEREHSPDEENSIDSVVAWYKESLKANDKTRWREKDKTKTKEEQEKKRRESLLSERRQSSISQEAACFGRHHRDSATIAANKRRVSFVALQKRTSRRAARQRRQVT